MHLDEFRRRPFFLFLIVFLASVLAQAQQDQGDGKDAANFSSFAFTVGPTLPNKIDGVTEIMPTGAASFGTHFGSVMMEFAFHLVNTFGYEFYNPSASIRLDIPLESLTGIALIGFDDTYFHGPNQSFSNQFGVHFGGGILASVTKNVFIRGDMKFNVNPGTSLYIGMGLEFHWSGGGGNGAAQ